MKFLLIILLFLISSCKHNSMEKKLINFIKEHEEKVISLSKETNLAYFNASISGAEEAFKNYSELNLKLNKVYNSKEAFKKLTELKSKIEDIKDLELKRQLEVLYNSYKANQIDTNLLEQIISLQNKLEEIYSTHRVNYNGNNISDNEVDKILKESTNSSELEAVWSASKEISNLIEDDFKKLLVLRNKAAIELGYKNFHEMNLLLSEIEPSTLDALFKELDELTRPTFVKLKKEIDTSLAKKLKINENALMPWHYQNKFFQDAPKIYDLDLDYYFKDEDLLAITKRFYNGIGLNINQIIERSDLFEKQGKYQHAYCVNIDRIKDVRVLCNTKDNHYWMRTLLHEFGHGVYDYYLDSKLSWTLRTPAHIFTTEAVAMLFDRYATNPYWIKEFINSKNKTIDAEKIKAASFNTLALEKIIFSRWALTVYNFEKEMYSNPDQDLNKLWWDTVSKYQHLKKPENRNMPDYLSKIHIALYPVYYQNYLLGDVLASQLQYHLVNKVLHLEDVNKTTLKDRKEVGVFMLSMFEMANLYEWNTMIERLTGEKLTAKYYAKQFIE